MTSFTRGREETSGSRSDWTARGTWLAAWLMLVPAGLAVWMAAALLHDIPWGDHLTLFRDTGLARGISFESLFRFHNEHLIVPTKLAVALDYQLWHGANLLPAAACLLLTLGIVAIETWMFRRAVGGLSPAQMAVVTAMLAAVLVNGRLTWTLTFPILLQHVSANACVVVAIAAFATLAAGTSGHRGRAFAICLAAAGLAAISSAAGVFTLPAATAATLLLVVVSSIQPARGTRPPEPGSRRSTAGVVDPRHRRGTAVGLPGLASLHLDAVGEPLRGRPWRGPVLAGLLIGGGIVAAYAAAYGLATPATGRPRPDIVQALRFAIYFPGGAWFRDGTWPIAHRADPLLLHAVVLGFWLILAVVAIRRWRRRDALGEFEVFHASLLLFVLLTALVGGLFRGGLGDLEALNKKYPPTSLLAWASLVSLVLRDRLEWLFAAGPRGLVRPLAAAVLIVAAILPGDFVEYRAWSAWRDELRDSIRAYAAGLRTDRVLLHFFPDADQADRLLAAVEQDEGYWFRHRDGAELLATASPTPLPAGGRLERIPDHSDYALEFINAAVEPLGKPPVRLSRGSALRLAGWAVDRQAGSVPAAVELILDGTRYRCRSGLPRGDVAEFFQEPGFAAAGFECLLPAGSIVPGSHTLRLWIVLADGSRYLETPTYRIVVE
jgi:hypothetical protein